MSSASVNDKILNALYLYNGQLNASLDNKFASLSSLSNYVTNDSMSNYATIVDLDNLSDTYVTNATFSAAIATIQGGGLSVYIGNNPPENFNGFIFDTSDYE